MVEFRDGGTVMAAFCCCGGGTVVPWGSSCVGAALVIKEASVCWCEESGSWDPAETFCVCMGSAVIKFCSMLKCGKFVNDDPCCCVVDDENLIKFWIADIDAG